MESNAYLLDRNKINTEELSILEFLIKQQLKSGLLDIKWS